MRGLGVKRWVQSPTSLYPILKHSNRGEAVGLGGKSGWRGVCRKRKEGESEDWIGLGGGSLFLSLVTKVSHYGMDGLHVRGRNDND